MFIQKGKFQCSDNPPSEIRSFKKYVATKKDVLDLITLSFNIYDFTFEIFPFCLYLNSFK